jgi:hypothetical protein
MWNAVSIGSAFHMTGSKPMNRISIPHDRI